MTRAFGGIIKSYGQVGEDRNTWGIFGILYFIYIVNSCAVHLKRSICLETS